MKKVLFLGFLFCASFSLLAQDLRVEPLNWWVGMKNPNLQLLIKGKDLNRGVVTSSKKGLSVKKVTNGDSPNYLSLI
jgi:neopullulanase